MENLPVEKRDVLKEMAAMQFDLSLVEEPDTMEAAQRLSFTQIAALGTAFEPVVSAFQSVFSGGAASGIYQVTVPGGHLAQLQSGEGYIGTILNNATNQISGQATLNPLMLSPAMVSSLFMAAALSGIVQKLDRIERTQQEILNFLAEKEKSERRGNLIFLSDILKNYQYNWNNEKYKNNNHIKVLDIRQSSEHQIDFARTQIEKQTENLSLPHGDHTVKQKIEKMKGLFRDYQFSVYLYSFSTFLEVMLLENFDANFLDGMVEKIREYTWKYRELYTVCYELLEKSCQGSIQSKMLQGLAKSGYMMGKVAEKVPLASKGQLDERLIHAGEWLGTFDEMRTERSMQRFAEKPDRFVAPFIENIEMINHLYNQRFDLAFDQEGLYLKPAEDAG